MSSGQRFPNLSIDVPGPGAYNTIGEISTLTQTCGQFPNARVYSLKTNEKRPDWVNRFKTPGPGSYRQPSDFGYKEFTLMVQKDMERS